ncbi:hypothetical protein [uncultured Georgenia sp.]|uniref:hypothetical protein n=1 Tax=uncultured Georgenia sp. TaxID=378209 RepID=UPI00262CB83E|nr:hypothetical protein [uncultured Georgenia sp.]HLV04398.1 hypothetical protein [Actinomycetaceae bacterium]
MRSLRARSRNRGRPDGVGVIPYTIVADIVDATPAQEDEDAWIAQRVAAGHAIEGLSPMNREWRARYEKDKG